MQLSDISAARKSISGIADATPMIPSRYLSQIAGSEFQLKLENMQPIGAFKLRGAVNAISNLQKGVPGVTCCSTGNHGRGVAYAARSRGMKAVICMSSLVSQAKIDGIKALGAEVRVFGDSQDDAFDESQRLAREEGLIEISPFDDPFVIAGQGTIGMEMIEVRPDIATVVVPLSGGGLAGGVALALKAIKPDIKVVGVSMERGAAMYQSICAGHPVEVVEVASLADSLGGGIGADNQLSFPLCRDLLDDVMLVSEEEIYRAMQTLFYEERMVAEGASVVAIAALQSGKLKGFAGPFATIITARNGDMNVFRRIINGEDIVLGDLKIKGQSYDA